MSRLKSMLILLIITHKAFGSTQITSLAMEKSPLDSQPLVELITNIYKEKAFQSLLIVSDNKNRCHNTVQQLLDTNFETTIPKVLLTTDTTFSLKVNFNQQFLALCCVEQEADVSTLLKNLANSLERMRATRIIFSINIANSNYYALLYNLLRVCENLQMPNFLIIFNDFASTKTFFTNNKFPRLQLEETVIGKKTVYFPNRLKDLHGYALQTMPTLCAPGAILYHDKAGEMQLIGYVVKLIRGFAQRLNATLSYNSSPEVAPLVGWNIAKVIRKHELDISMCLATPTEIHTLHVFSDIVEITSWLPMLPRTSHVPVNAIFMENLRRYLLLHLWLYFCYALLHTIIIQQQQQQRPRCLGVINKWLDMLLNDRILRGLLGFAFPQPSNKRVLLRLIYLLVFVQGLVLNAYFNARLSSYITHPPMQRVLNSFDDLKSSGTKILITRSELDMLKEISTTDFWQRYRCIFKIVKSQAEFLNRCQRLQRAHACAMRSTNWHVLGEQLRHYFGSKQPLVPEDSQLYFHDFLLMAVPLPANSVYRESFNNYLLEVKAVGLWQYWTKNAYNDMVTAGLLSFNNVRKRGAYNAMSISDFSSFWWVYLAALVVCFAALLAEFLCWSKKRRHENTATSL